MPALTHSAVPGIRNSLPRLSADSGVRRAPSFLTFLVTGCLVAVGYMDPGNWATSVGAGSAFGFSLLSVLLAASLAAMLLQGAAIRLGVVTGNNLAEACRDYFPAWINRALWLACEIAIVACNLAEVLGMALGLMLVFHITLTLAVFLTVLDVLLVMTMKSAGVGRLEAFIVGLVLLIAGSLAIELYWLRPSLGALLASFGDVPETLRDSRALYLAVGIVGATVMPHNLYLHSALVVQRTPRTDAQTRSDLRSATWASNCALGLAFLVNAAILILAAGAFHGLAEPPGDLTHAYDLLSPVLGVRGASTIFGLGLIAAGLSSSVTGTIAGQIVMEGFLALRWAPWKRALVTRGLALLPAAVVVALTGSRGLQSLLVLSQVVLAIQLPLTALPLLWFTTRRCYLGPLAFGFMSSVVLWVVGGSIFALDAVLTIQMLRS